VKQTIHKIGKKQAIALLEAKWWEGLPVRSIVGFQLFTDLLCMPFGDFQAAVEKALGRSVWTPEFASADLLRKEFLGDRPAPTLAEIIDLIPEEKRLAMILTPQSEETEAR
jgi:hypothetical protein